MKNLTERYERIKQIAMTAGDMALKYYQNRADLVVEKKQNNGQDLVTLADQQVEHYIKTQLQHYYPEDAILGEESGSTSVSAKYTWVIDPIDGTSAFIFGLPSWCISIALQEQHTTKIGVIYDPIHQELFHAMQNQGAFLNASPIKTNTLALNEGLLGLGVSTRIPPESFIKFLTQVIQHQGVFIRNGSAALMLAYVAAGKLIGFFEGHLNPWDYLAGVFLIEEAGGKTALSVKPENRLLDGSSVLACNTEIYAQLQSFLSQSA